jgi:hypothetical protein
VVGSLGPHGRLKFLSAAAVSMQEAADRLAKAIIGPEVLTGLPRRIAIVADGALQSVPFGLLPAEEGRAARERP